MLALRGVAQPGSAPALGAGCREFESLHADQNFWVLEVSFTFNTQIKSQPEKLVLYVVDDIKPCNQNLPVAQPDRAPAF